MEYPKHCDLVILPCSGRSGITKVEGRLVDRLESKAILIDHFDDTFPPVSSRVDPEEFMREMEKRGIPVIKPEYKEKIVF